MRNETVVTHRLLIQQASQFPDLVALHDEIGPRHSIGLFADYFEQQMAAGKLRKSDPMKAAEDFAALAVGQSRVRRLFGGMAEPGNAEVEARAKHAAEIFLRAYGPPKE